MFEVLFALALMAQTTPDAATPPPTTPPAATEPAPAQPATPDAEQKKNTEIVCKRVQRNTESRLGRGQRVCRPAWEWENASEAARKTADDITRSFRGNPETQ